VLGMESGGRHLRKVTDTLRKKFCGGGLWVMPMTEKGRRGFHNLTTHNGEL